MSIPEYGTMIDARAMPHYSNKAGLYLGHCISFGTIALFFLSLRIYTRIHHTRRMYLEDWLMVFAEPLSLASTGAAIASTTYGWGRPLAYFTPADLESTLKLQYAVSIIWPFTIWLVRVSVALSLLRLGAEKIWRWPLYLIMVIQTVISASYLVIQLAQCTPISANWDTLIVSQCRDQEPIIVYGWVKIGQTLVHHST
jgi:hypothetical protein